MSAKWGEVDYLVLGNSPGGVWLLPELRELFPSATLGWLRSVTPPPPLLVLSDAVAFFRLSGTKPISSEILWPQEGMAWTRESILKRFPKLAEGMTEGPRLSVLKPNQWGMGALQTGEAAFLRKAIAQYPELVGFADAFWKVFGKSSNVSLETKVWSSFQCIGLNEWHFDKQGEELRTDFCCNLETEIERIRLTSDGFWEIQVLEKGTILAKHLLLSPTLRELGALSKRFQVGRLPWESVLSLEHAHSLYPFCVDIERPGVPEPMRDLTFCLDTHDIPEPETEIWPVERVKGEANETLRFLIDGPADPDLDLMAARFQQAALRLNELLPLSRNHILCYRPGLQFEECSGGNTREVAIQSLMDGAIERYSWSLMEPRTRWQNLYFLGPFFFTQWPYPLGELWAGRLVKDLLTPKKKQVAVSTSPPR